MRWRRVEGIKKTSAPEGSFIFIKGVLCRCAGESIRCDGFVVEITSNILSDLEQN